MSYIKIKHLEIQNEGRPVFLMTKLCKASLVNFYCIFLFQDPHCFLNGNCSSLTFYIDLIKLISLTLLRLEILEIDL